MPAANPEYGGNTYTPIPGPTVVTHPDWDALIDQWMNPHKQASTSNLAALAARLEQLRNFARQRFGITGEGIEDAHEQAVLGIKNMLSAHGMYDSGDRKYRLRMENRSYKRAKDAAENQLLEYLAGLSNQYDTANNAALQGLQTTQQGMLTLLPTLYGPTTSNAYMPPPPNTPLPRFAGSA